MARAIAYARTARPRIEAQIEEIARVSMVAFCGLALAMAGSALPF